MSDADQADPGSLAAYRAAVNGVAGVVTAVGLLGLWGSTYLPEGAVQTAVETLSAAILAIGVLQVLSQAYLHRRLSGELFGELGAIENRVTRSIEEGGNEVKAMIDVRVGGVERLLDLDRRLSPSGVEAVERASVDWRRFIGASSEIDVIPTDLTSWLSGIWPVVLEVAKTRPLTVTLHLANVNGSEETATALSLRTGLEVERLRTEFGEAVAALKGGWREGETKPGSRLLIHTCDGIAGFGVVFTEQAWATLLPRASGPHLGTQPLVSLFGEGTDPGFLAWAKSQPGYLGSTFFDEVQ